MRSFDGMYSRIKPFLIVTLLQLGYAGLSIICKFALNKGMSPIVFAVYRHAVATITVAPFAIVLDRNVRPKMTLSTFVKIFLLGLLKPIEHNLYYTGLKYTTATFATAMSNIAPALVFFMAWIFRLEKVSIRKVHSQGKILGTIVTIAGAMLMTSVKGPMLDLPWTKANREDQETDSSTNMRHPIKGALFVAISCLVSSSFIILQAITLKSYPAEFSLTALICLMGTIEGTVLALVLERAEPAVWSIHLDYKLLAAVYSGVIATGLAYYIQGAIIKERGPVFVAAFTPLCMVIVAIMGSFLLAEIMHLGRVIGAVVIVLGLYLVLWGKSKDQTSSSSECSNKAAASTDHQMVRINGGILGTLNNKDVDQESTAALDQQNGKTERAHESV